MIFKKIKLVNLQHAILTSCLKGGRRPFRALFELLQPVKSEAFLGRTSPPYTVSMGMSTSSLPQIGVLHPGAWLTPALGKGPVAT